MTDNFKTLENILQTGENTHEEIKKQIDKTLAEVNSMKSTLEDFQNLAKFWKFKNKESSKKLMNSLWKSMKADIVLEVENEIISKYDQYSQNKNDNFNESPDTDSQTDLNKIKNELEDKVKELENEIFNLNSQIVFK